MEQRAYPQSASHANSCASCRTYENETAIIGQKQGIPIYKSNPSVPIADFSTKREIIRYGNERKGFVVDNSSGEILNVGGAGFYEFEEVDKTRFVKLFLAGVKHAAGFCNSGVTLFEVVYRGVQENPGEGKVKLSYFAASDQIEGLTERTYQRGLRELLNKEFLYRSPSDGVFFAIIRFMFNGDRLAFVRGYKLKEHRQPN